MTMTAITFKAPARQKAILDSEADRLGISQGELIRRIIDEHTIQAPAPSPPNTNADGKTCTA